VGSANAASENIKPINNAANKHIRNVLRLFPPTSIEVGDGPAPFNNVIPANAVNQLLNFLFMCIKIKGNYFYWVPAFAGMTSPMTSTAGQL